MPCPVSRTRHRDRAIPSPRAARRPSRRRRELHRVGEQVPEHLLQPARVPQDRHARDPDVAADRPRPSRWRPAAPTPPRSRARGRCRSAPHPGAACPLTMRDTSRRSSMSWFCASRVAVDDLDRAPRGRLVQLARQEHLRPPEDRVQRRPQLVRERRQELVLRAVRLDQRRLGALQAADIEVDAGPAHGLAVLVAHRHPAREHRVPLPVHAAIPVLDVPRAARARALLPRGDRPLRVVGMKDRAPAEVRALLLRDADQAEERLARVDVAPVRLAHPHPVRDGLADCAVQPLAVAQGLFLLAQVGVDAQDLQDLGALAGEPLGEPELLRRPLARGA